MVVAMYSGGVCSHLAAKRAVERHGAQAVTLLFSDTGMEDPDLHRFIEDGARLLGAPLVKLPVLEDLFALARRKRMIPNDRVPFCSQMLKHTPAERWVQVNAPTARLVFGLDWTEPHRLSKVKRRWAGHECDAPMMEPPYRFKPQMLDECRADGIEPPALYAEGFQHNNCGGACVRAGHAAWAHLLGRRPDTYARWEAFEEAMRAELGKDVSILTDRRGGDRTPLTLRAFRLRLQSGGLFDECDWGGCGCFVEEAPGPTDRLEVRS